MSKDPRPYHHGDLPTALLSTTEALILEKGVASLSLREVARRAGVSHGAPAHHFGDKSGLLTALAIEGFRRFIAALTAARDGAGSRVSARSSATGKAYVRFAVANPAHFEVMFRRELLKGDDAELARVSSEAYQVLQRMVAEHGAQGTPEDQPIDASADLRIVALRAWSFAHGLAELYLASPTAVLQRAGQPDLDALLDAVFGPDCVAT